MMLENSTRLSLIGWAIGPKIVFIVWTQKLSARKSESAKITTAPLPEATTSGTAFVEPSFQSGPFGNAVLNVPERRAASVRFTPSGRRSFIIAPMPNCAPMRSIMHALSDEVVMSGSNSRPSVLANESAPENGSMTCVRPETTMSPSSMLPDVSERNAGFSSARPLPAPSLVAAARSATSLEVSNETPQASKSLPSVDGPSCPPICIIIGFCCWREESMSITLNGSTQAMRRPPLMTNWSIAKSVFSERSLAWRITSALTSLSMDSAVGEISRTS